MTAPTQSGVRAAVTLITAVRSNLAEDNNVIAAQLNDLLRSVISDLSVDELHAMVSALVVFCANPLSPSELSELALMYAAD